MKSASTFANHLFYLLSVLCFLSSCRSQQAVQVVKERHDHDSTRILVDHRRDSVYIDRTHSIVQRGDTVFRTDSIYIHEVTEVQVHDTTYIATHDSVPEPVPNQSKPPDDPIPRIYIWSTAILWTLVLVGVVVIIIRIRRKIVTL